MPVDNGGQIVSISGFDDNTVVEEVRLPNSLTSIGTYAFRNCTSLTNVVPLLPRTVTQIDRRVFQNTAIEGSLYVGHSGNIVLGEAFFEGTRLSAVHLGEGVHSLGDGLFYAVSTLTEFYFYGDAPTSFGNYYTFAEIPAYQMRFYLPKQNESWEAFATINIQPLSSTEEDAFQTAYPGERDPIGT